MSDISDAAKKMRKVRENGTCGKFAQQISSGDDVSIATDYSGLTEAIEDLLGEVYVAKSEGIVREKLQELSVNVKQERAKISLGELNSYLSKIETTIIIAVERDESRNFETIENKLQNCLDILLTMQITNEWLAKNKNYELIN